MADGCGHQLTSAGTSSIWDESTAMTSPAVRRAHDLAEQFLAATPMYMAR
ncbi:hypothetical protein [Streptomyces chartreusis]